MMRQGSTRCIQHLGCVRVQDMYVVYNLFMHTVKRALVVAVGDISIDVRHVCGCALGAAAAAFAAAAPPLPLPPRTYTHTPFMYK